MFQDRNSAEVAALWSVFCFCVFFCACISIFLSSAGRGRPPTEPLPDGWIMTFHNSGIPVYLHRETRVVTWSRPYFLGTGSIRVGLDSASPQCFALTQLKTSNSAPPIPGGAVFYLTYSVAGCLSLKTAARVSCQKCQIFLSFRNTTLPPAASPASTTRT